MNFLWGDAKGCIYTRGGFRITALLGHTLLNSSLIHVHQYCKSFKKINYIYRCILNAYEQLRMFMTVEMRTDAK